MMPDRSDIWNAAGAAPDVPVLILGGGVNGCGCLRDLALQRIDALLVDKADFVAGASSKSSRMIHGGLRYLEHHEFRLVRESLIERNRLLETAAHYVSPLKTTIPLFSWLGGMIRSSLIFLGLPVRPGGRGGVITKLGLTFYDFVTRRRRMTPRHFFTSREETLRGLPGLTPEIVAAANYYDAQISQAERLCIEMIRDARNANPRCRAVNYVRAEGVEDGAVILRDEVTGEEAHVTPQVVVNATGAWVDRTNAALGVETKFIGGTKGSHLIVDNPTLHAALGDRMVYYQHTDGRVCIVFPFGDKVLMGSTDIRIDDPDAARCDASEIAYMLETLRGIFPGVDIRRGQIVYVFCGVRPLPATGEGVTANISRGHSLRVLEAEGEPPLPVLCLIGGKWTTFRVFAEETADAVLARLGASRRCSTEATPIGGGRDFPRGEDERHAWIDRLTEVSGLHDERVATLLSRYGTAAEAYARAASTEDETPLAALPDYTVGEVRRIAAEEQVVHLDDLVCRRSTIALSGRAGREALEELAGIVGDVLGWDAGRRAEEVERTLAEVAVPGS
jgi:glycerol-3-phosphate dehydrogenase